MCIAIGIGLGTGLGVGLRSQQTASSPASQSTSSIVPSNTSPPILKNGVLNDTSLTSAVTPDGNRHLVFQDINGTLRHAQFSTTTGSWLPSIDFVFTQRRPKNHAPLAATAISSLETGPIAYPLLICFIDSTDSLTTTQYPYKESTYATLLNESIPVAHDTRSLSISRIPSSNDSEADPTSSSIVVRDEYLLFYETPTNGLALLHGLYFLTDKAVSNTNETEIVDGWAWKNASDLLYSDGLSEFEAPISAPFAASYDNQTFGFYAYFCNSKSIHNSSADPVPSWAISSIQNLSRLLDSV